MAPGHRFMSARLVNAGWVGRQAGLDTETLLNTWGNVTGHPVLLAGPVDPNRWFFSTLLNDGIDAASAQVCCRRTGYRRFRGYGT